MTTHQTAPTLRVSTPSGSTTFAYRRLGTATGAPLLILTHFRGVMDKYDPSLINALAQSRRLILVDYAGVGLSIPGTVATSTRQSAADILTFLELIGEREIDVMGFSLGGVIAQLVALNADPAVTRVRKVILAGTTPSAGEGVKRTANADTFDVAGAKEVGVETFKTLFFLKNGVGDAAAEQWWARIHERGVATSGEEPATWLSQGYADGAVGLKAQSAQTASWMTEEGSKGDAGSYGRLPGLEIPVLVVNGHVSVPETMRSRSAPRRQRVEADMILLQDDYMVPTFNSYTMQQRLPNAQLIIYPNSGHGAIFQYSTHFAQQVLTFLSS